MAEKRMTFTVKKNGGGAFTVKTGEGFVGSQCEAEVEALIGAIGAQVTDGGDTPERTMERDASAMVDMINS